MCKKSKPIDKILLVTPDAYKRSTLVLTVEILVVFCVVGVIHAFELQDRHLGYIMMLVNFGWILVGYVNNTVILQFLNCFRLLKNRFNKPSTRRLDFSFNFGFS
jgi:hypothetical protein